MYFREHLKFSWTLYLYTGDVCVYGRVCVYVGLVCVNKSYIHRFVMRCAVNAVDFYSFPFDNCMHDGRLNVCRRRYFIWTHFRWEICCFLFFFYIFVCISAKLTVFCCYNVLLHLSELKAVWGGLLYGRQRGSGLIEKWIWNDRSKSYGNRSYCYFGLWFFRCYVEI